MPVLRFVAKRLAGTVVILLAVGLLVFSLLTLSPGSVVDTLLGDQQPTPEAVRAIEARYHLDDPFIVQYGHWLTDALGGDLGVSMQSGEPVTRTISAQLPLTLQLAGCALILVCVFGVTIGVAAGVRSGGKLDRTASAGAIVGMSIPGFAVGILLIHVFGVQLGWFPVYGAGDSGFADRLSHLVLPAVALAVNLVALLMRQSRAAVLHVMEQDYITFARARGLNRRRIMVRYALRNTALPVVTAAGLLLIVAISGAALVESVFSLPGVGQLMVQSVNAKDMPVVQGVTICVAALVVVVNLLVDVLALVIDPRTRLSPSGRT
ncbi:Dipeptide transport system permease protein DppB [Streptomyces sp. YIM 130001]|uniref:ABC transporter permease n=1 Tax=Streptomyces sp. YIM 130001 TaxID=2259644 RepID=UPI000E646616|nr:ABC transporter permease [Streptomyces sp. YIM 130001]RII20651.1 Dipeptide transport system permease protein DppB [Streptomyces sp. YIM 130001]